MFTIGIEMILGHNFSKHEPEVETSSSIIPISFLLIVIARTGILTTVISLKAEYEQWNILIGIIINLIFVYIILKLAKTYYWAKRNLGLNKVIWHYSSIYCH